MFIGFKYMLQCKIRNLKNQFWEQVYISYLSTQSMLIDVTFIVPSIGNWSKSSSYCIKYLCQSKCQNTMIQVKSYDRIRCDIDGPSCHRFILIVFSVHLPAMAATGPESYHGLFWCLLRGEVITSHRVEPSWKPWQSKAQWTWMSHYSVVYFKLSTIPAAMCWAWKHGGAAPSYHGSWSSHWKQRLIYCGILSGSQVFSF